MGALSKKLLASLAVMATLAAAFTSLVIMGPIEAQALNCPLNEDFSDSWLPAGWTQEEAGEWIQWSDDSAGGTSPEADLAWDLISGDYAYLDSKPVDTTGAPGLTLEFKSFIDDYCCSEGLGDPDCDSGGGCGSYDCKVYTRANGGDSWTDVTPWSNPIDDGSVGPDTYLIDISSDIGSATQVRFEFNGYYFAIDDWYVDDVKICSSDGVCQDEPSPQLGLASVADEIVIAYYYAGAGVWDVYWPDFDIDTIGTLEVGNIYIVYVDSDCTLMYCTQSYELNGPDWNFIYWFGQ